MNALYVRYFFEIAPKNDSKTNKTKQKTNRILGIDFNCRL